jgi:hypothetical protein
LKNSKANRVSFRAVFVMASDQQPSTVKAGFPKMAFPAVNGCIAAQHPAKVGGPAILWGARNYIFASVLSTQ